MRRGSFITFEGGEGVGKSTQIARLAEALRARGQVVVTTREPGGTPSAERIRELLVAGDVASLGAHAELFLVLAARAEHIRHVLAPALLRGETVICDRFSDSTRVYQGLAGGLGLDLVDQAGALLPEGGLVPDLTLLLDLDVDTASARARTRGEGGRFERKSPEFHAAVRAGFLQLAAAEPTRFAILDAAPAEDRVARAVLEIVTSRLAA